jgi:hypothetical protein
MASRKPRAPRKPKPPSEAEQHAAIVASLSAVPVGQELACKIGETGGSVAIERLSATLVWWYGYLPGNPYGGKLDIPRAADLVLRAGGERVRAARLVRRSRGRVTMDEAREAATRCLESTRDYLATRRVHYLIGAWREAVDRRNGIADLRSSMGWMFAHYGARSGEWPGELWFYGRDGVDPRGFAMARTAAL